MSEAAAIAALDSPHTVSSLHAELNELGVCVGDVLLVHSSMKAIGWTVGGAQAVVEALLEAVGSTGTIVMPTQSSQLSDPALWESPPVPESWIQTIREQMPAYNPGLTPTRGMGQIVECFRGHDSSLRSAHPLNSFVANGAQAPNIVNPHELAEGFTDESPLGRMYELGARVLFLGATHASNTSLHLAEHRAHWSGKSDRDFSAPVLVNGRRTWTSWTELDLDDDDFVSIGQAFEAAALESENCIIGRVGSAESTLMSQRALVDFASEWMSLNR